MAGPVERRARTPTGCIGIEGSKLVEAVVNSTDWKLTPLPEKRSIEERFVLVLEGSVETGLEKSCDVACDLSKRQVVLARAQGQI